MKVLVEAVKTSRGRFSLLASFGGVLFIVFGNYLFHEKQMSDMVLILGSLISIIGTQSFCVLIVAIRNSGNKDGK